MNKKIFCFLMGIVIIMATAMSGMTTAFAADKLNFTTPITIGVDSTDGDTNIVFEGQTLSVGYNLSLHKNESDLSEIKWLRSDKYKTVIVKRGVASEKDASSYTLTNDDLGCVIKVNVTPITSEGRRGNSITAKINNTVNKSNKSGAINGTVTKDSQEGTCTVYIAGDSTVKSYGEERDEGGWGEFIPEFFENLTINNYSNGGRSTRNFINEGSLDKIAENIKDGDYLFIQFGHNDCSDKESNIVDRYVPLGTPDSNGKFPIIAGEETITKDSGLTDKLLERYGEKYYPYTSGTYKWYLKQYIDAAKKVGATPVLVTPVSRMQFDENGKITPHHDDSKTKDNSYVKAMKQLAEEENVYCIDLFETTKEMYEEFGIEKSTGLHFRKDETTVDNTHYNKFGGLYVASIMAREIQNSDLAINKNVKKADESALEGALKHTEEVAALPVKISDELIAEYKKSLENIK